MYFVYLFINMAIVVPFDGTALSETALLHAHNSSKLYEQPVIAVTVIPSEDKDYAREHGWITEEEEFDKETITSRLQQQVKEICPDADFEYISVPRTSSSGTISSRLRRFAKDRDASAVFIGSENAGRLVIGITSVGGRVAADLDYDVAIFREALPETELVGKRVNAQ
jgi:nucleotide-binding universal stress UspA family protein